MLCKLLLDIMIFSLLQFRLLDTYNSQGLFSSSVKTAYLPIFFNSYQFFPTLVKLSKKIATLLNFFQSCPTFINSSQSPPYSRLISFLSSIFKLLSNFSKFYQLLSIFFNLFPTKLISLNSIQSLPIFFSQSYRFSNPYLLKKKAHIKLSTPF